MHRCAPIIGLLVLGCSPDSRFDLHLEPIVPQNLEMALGEPDLTLVHRVGDASTLTPLGASEATSFEDFPPLSDGIVGLLLTDPGSASNTYDPRMLRGYGEAPLGGALGADGEERTVQLLITEFAGTGDLGELTRRVAPLFGAGALLPDGTAVIFGGQRDGVPHGHVSVLSALPSDFAFREVDDLPSPQVLFTATPLQDGTVLLAGGRPQYFTVGDNLQLAMLWDPVTEGLIWSSSTAMNTGRSRHQAVAMRDGRVLVVGGWQGVGVDTDSTTYQFFDPVDRRFQLQRSPELTPCLLAELTPPRSAALDLARDSLQ